MKDEYASGRNLVKTGERILGHTLVAGVGFVLMIAGLGMGVTMVMLPIGIPVGLLGLLLFVWGLFSRPSRSQVRSTVVQPSPVSGVAPSSVDSQSTPSPV
jgi:hypothetical protein